MFVGTFAPACGSSVPLHVCDTDEGKKEKQFFRGDVMRNRIKSILIGLAVTISVADVLADAPSANGVVIEQTGRTRFRLVNNSTENVTYMQFVRLDAPVVYCKLATADAKLCAMEQYVSANGKAEEKEAVLAPGKSINFKTNGMKADAVGVALSIN
jgi:hypothetical protein